MKYQTLTGNHINMSKNYRKKYYSLEKKKMKINKEIRKKLNK